MEVAEHQIQWEREEEREEEQQMTRQRRPVINGDDEVAVEEEGSNSNNELSLPENVNFKDEISVPEDSKSNDELFVLENGQSKDELSVTENGKSRDELSVTENGIFKHKIFKTEEGHYQFFEYEENGQVQSTVVDNQNQQNLKDDSLSDIKHFPAEKPDEDPEITPSKDELFVSQNDRYKDELSLTENGQSKDELSVTENGIFKHEIFKTEDGHFQFFDYDENGQVQSTVVNNQYQQNSKDDSLSDIKLVPTEKSFEGPEITQSSNDVTIKEGDEELNDLDVEGVLKEQNTHDLFCPNCHSCITRRVILRKRKRNIKYSEEDGKRSKPEVDTISEDTTDNSNHPIINTTVDSSSQTPAADEYNRDTDPDVFRCLSCFTFFIPTGNGFKLFNMFGDKKEKENVQREQTSLEKKNWLSSIFKSRKGETVVDRDVQTTFSVASPQEIDSSPSPLVVSSSAEGPERTEKVVANTGEKPDQIQKEATDYKDWLFPESNSVYGESENKLDLVTGVPSKYGKDFEVKQAIPIQSTVQVQNVEVTFSDSSYSDSYGVTHNNVGTKVDIHIEKTQIANADASSPSLTTSLLLPDNRVANITKDLMGVPQNTNTGGDTLIIVTEKPAQTATSQQAQDTVASEGTGISSLRDNVEDRGFQGVEVIKSIVYGGLVETVTSLGVVSSAAGSETAIINIVALGLANLFGGLFVICQSLWDLKNDDHGLVSGQGTENAPTQTTQRIDKYRDLLGQRENFFIHATIAILSYIIFGLLPPVVYGFSFRESNDRYFKLLTVSAASLLCITVLSVGKAYIQRPPKPYVKTVFYYVALGFMASGVSYVAGDLTKKLIEKLGWLNTAADLSVPIMRKSPVQTGWSSY